jgi:hypothetical protein
LNLDTVQEMVALKKYIKMNFKIYLNSLRDSKRWANELDVEQFAEDLFYNNGYEFCEIKVVGTTIIVLTFVVLKVIMPSIQVTVHHKAYRT